MVAGVLSAIPLAGCATGAPAPQVSQILPAAADRSSSGEVIRQCGSHYASDFDPGTERRVVQAGPVALLASRMSPEPTDGPVRIFKLMLRLEPGSVAVVRVTTAGTNLLYDRTKFQQSNRYQLDDGDRVVRFVGCPDRAALFNGAVLTTGPHTVELAIDTAGARSTVTVTAFGG